MPSWTMRGSCNPAYSRYTVDKDTHIVGNRTVVFSEVKGTEDAVLYGQLTSYTESGKGQCSQTVFYQYVLVDVLLYILID